MTTGEELRDWVEDIDRKVIGEIKRLNARIAELEAERDRLKTAIRGGLRKMQTYAGIYDGDKELTRLLAEWTEIDTPRTQATLIDHKILGRSTT